MASAFPVHSSYRSRVSPGRRAAALALAAGLVLLVILMLIQLGIGTAYLKDPERPLNTVTVLPPSAAKAGSKAPAKRETTRSAGAAPRSETPRPLPQAAPPPPPPVPSPAPPKMLSLSKDAFAATDIGGMRSSGGEGEGSAGSGRSSGAVYGPGEGPGGEQLFNVAWYREPTDAELSTYLPKRDPGAGQGTVACRMIERYHVENCRELSESPLGSGYARTVRLAAWQFLVRPPRVGAKVMLGSWVRIRVDFTRRAAPDAPARSEGIMGGAGHPPPDDN